MRSNPNLRSLISFAVVFFLFQGFSSVRAQSAGQLYLEFVRESVAGLRTGLPQLEEFAEEAASHLAKSEALIHIRSSENFSGEMNGRAGGLGVNTKGGSEASMHPDAVFFLGYTSDDRSKPGQVGNAGRIRNGYTVLFSAPEVLRAASRKSKYKFKEDSFSAVIDNQTGKREAFKSGGITYSTASLLNIVNGWVFTGEMTAALTRLGRMPIYYLSFAIDQRNDYVRAGKYSRVLSPGLKYGPMKSFHDDVIISDSLASGNGMMVIPPLEPGFIGGRYLDILDGYLAAYASTNFSDIQRIVDRAVRVIEAGGTVFFESIGHTFPNEVHSKERLRGVLHVISQGWNRDDYTGPGPGTEDLMIVLGMPTFPITRAIFAAENNIELVMLSTEKPTDRDPENYDTDQFLWLETPWPMGDGAVEIPGYDIKVLPVTGFMNGVLYYTIKAELEQRLAN